MAFLRISRGIVRGKKFVSRKRAAEYLWRLETNTLACGEGGGTCGLARSYSVHEKGKYPGKGGKPGKPGRFLSSEQGFMGDTSPSNPKPKKFRPAPSGACRKVYRHGLLWRVTVEDIWKSDHVSMEDALAGSNPIGIEPGTVKAGVVIVPQ